MPSKSYYNAELEYKGLESELARLKVQLMLSWERELRLLRWLGLQDGMTILELGCGPGYVTEQLQQSFPNSTIVSLDVDSVMLERAAAYLQTQTERVPDMVAASILATSFSDNQFDFAIARYLFQHLPEPIKAAREVRRVLKPGGTLAVIDVDLMLWGIVSPYYPQLHSVFGRTSPAEQGGNRLIGRQLWGILKKAGYNQPELDAFVYHSDSLGVEPFLPQIHPARLTRALYEKQIGLQEYALAQTYYQKFISSPDRYLLMCGLIASGKK